MCHSLFQSRDRHANHKYCLSINFLYTITKSNHLTPCPHGDISKNPSHPPKYALGSPQPSTKESTMSDTPIIETRENGPLILKGVKTFKMPDGSTSEEKPLHALCRCGASKNKPYCDGSHKDAGFDGASHPSLHRDIDNQFSRHAYNNRAEDQNGTINQCHTPQKLNPKILCHNRSNLM